VAPSGHTHVRSRRGDRVRRRDLRTAKALGRTTSLAGRAPRALKPDRVRRIGVLMAFTAGDAEGLYCARTIAQEFQDLG
jgi:hypothetical protein